MRVPEGRFVDVEMDQERARRGDAPRRDRAPRWPRATRPPRGARPASMWPPGCIQMPSRLCRCSTVPRRPTTMPDAVTWVGSGVLVAGRRQARRARTGSAAGPPPHAARRARGPRPGLAAPPWRRRLPDSPWSASLAQLAGQHRGRVPCDADPLPVRADVERRPAPGELVGHEVLAPQLGCPVGPGRALRRPGGGILVDPHVGTERRAARSRPPNPATRRRSAAEPWPPWRRWRPGRARRCGRPRPTRAPRR